MLALALRTAAPTRAPAVFAAMLTLTCEWLIRSTACRRMRRTWQRRRVPSRRRCPPWCGRSTNRTALTASQQVLALRQWPEMALNCPFGCPAVVVDSQRAVTRSIKHLLRARCSTGCLTLRAGLVLMQLSLPKLRTSNALRTFSQQLAACNHDLDLWRER